MATKETMSVFMPVYNAERYVLEQLNSIAAQTRLPDQVFICDDGSTDSSVALIDKFIETAPFPVVFHKSEKNQGYATTVNTLLTMVKGDIIVEADADDVFMPDYFAALEKLFRERPDVGLIFNNADIVDEKLSPLGTTFIESKDIHPPEPGVPFVMDEILFRRNVVYGACMSFRGAYLDLVLPIRKPGELGCHADSWITCCAMMSSHILFNPTSLVYYRQHAQQETGAQLQLREGSLFQRFIGQRAHAEIFIRDQLNMWTHCLEQMAQWTQVPVAPAKKQRAYKKQVFLKRRQSRAVIPFLCNLLQGYYPEFAERKLTPVIDFSRICKLF